MPVHACGRRCAHGETSSEADPARGRRGPSSEADPARGQREPSSEADLIRGGLSLRARRTSLEGALCRAALVGRGGHHGVGRVVCIFCVFLQVLSRIPPGFLGDPHDCPRHIFYLCFIIC
jgi:hypothetical protein